MHDAGASAAAAVLALLEPVDEHLVDFDALGFTVTHPLTERAEGTMHVCSLLEWLRALDRAPVGPGRYVAEQFSDGTWKFDPVARRGAATS